MELNTELEIYREIVESAIEMIMSHSEGEILYINQSGVNFLRARSKEEVLGKSAFDIVPEECWEIILKKE
jgi:rsbT co-antagonist protein RsbR